MLGPLTGARLEVIPPDTTLIGVRFHPGVAPPLGLPLCELVDQQVDLGELWGDAAERLGESVAGLGSADAALNAVQGHLLERLRRVAGCDPLVREAVRRLMPWQPVEIGALAEQLAISTSQLWRQCLEHVGLSPKALQRTLRFQAFLALAQARASRGGVLGLAGLAVDLGYADHAHLSRECGRLAGLSPRELVDGSVGRCEWGHDHAASYTAFLARRAVVVGVIG